MRKSDIITVKPIINYSMQIIVFLNQYRKGYMYGYVSMLVHLAIYSVPNRRTVTVCTDQSCISKVQTIYSNYCKYYEAFTFDQCFILLFLVLPCFKFHPTQPSLIFFSWGGYQSSGTVSNRRTKGHHRQILSRFSESILCV